MIALRKGPRMKAAFPTRPEVLAPAGDETSLRAAVQAGANAVYFGLTGFNARARATNFGVEELSSTMRYLHERGVKGYVTLNTLVFDGELQAVEEAVRACADAGVDAVIVQDFAVARLVRAIAPTLPVHASTQMTCTDASSVELAREIGASRVVVARELSIADLEKLRADTDVELEVFVHGALCISYSGQCLTSEAIGGRSANRGACAQACRLPYELVVDGEIVDTRERAFLLSPQDLEATPLVPELVRLGVSSFKIEGRLKGPDYVAATTRLYRGAIDAVVGEGVAPSEDERRTALQTFTRGSGTGFLGGADHQSLVEGRACDHRGLAVGVLEGVERVSGRTLLTIALAAEIARGDGLLVEGGFAGKAELGGRVWKILDAGADVERARHGATVQVWLGPKAEIPGAFFDREQANDSPKRVFRTDDPAATERIRTDLARTERRLRVDVTLRGQIGEHFVLEGTTESGARARVVGDTEIATAFDSKLDAEVLRAKIGRLGDSPFELGALDVSLPERALVPLSSVNRARRALASALAQATIKRHTTTPTTSDELLAGASPPDRAPPAHGVFVLCRTLDQAIAALDAGASGVYLDFLELTGTGAALRVLRERNAFVGVAPPRVRKPGEEKIDKYLRSLEPDAVLVRGLGALRECGRAREEGCREPLAIGDFSLNVTNRLSAAEVLSRGLHAFTPSFDLDAAQLTRLLSSPFAPWAEIVVHHPMALFHMEHCAIAALLSHGKDHRTCGRPCERHRVSLRDRAGMEHPVEADVGCRNTVFHAKAQSAAQLLPELARVGVGRYRIELVRESAAEVSRVVAAYRRAIENPKAAHEVWRELRTDDGYGVVRGSLRVLS